MESPPAPPELEHPLPPPPRMDGESAARLLQRWYRGVARRRRFMVIINRARRRRKYLEERRRIAQRVYTTEAVIEEMKARLAMPYGHRLVSRYAEARESEAATKVQTLWRSLRAKQKLVKLMAEQKQQEAAKKLQSFARRRWQHQRQSPLVRSAVANPFWRPIEDDKVKLHEKDVLQKRKEWSSLTGRGLTEPQLKIQAEGKYHEFLEGAGRWRYDVWRTLLERDQTRQMMEALTQREGGLGLDHPVMGLCSAFLLKDANEKHRQRIGSQMPGIATSVGRDSVGGVVESAHEENEAALLLHGLEAELGYDFSMPEL